MTRRSPRRRPWRGGWQRATRRIPKPAKTPIMMKVLREWIGGMASFIIMRSGDNNEYGGDVFSFTVADSMSRDALALVLCRENHIEVHTPMKPDKSVNDPYEPFLTHRDALIQFIEFRVALGKTICSRIPFSDPELKSKVMRAINEAYG